MNQLLRVGWSWYPSVLIGLGLWTFLYQRATIHSQTPLAQKIAFHLGTLAALLALVSPLDELGDEFLFSAHMVQHLLLIFVSAPLWLIGTPGWLIDKIFSKRFAELFKRLANPIFAFVVFVGVLFFWHIPTIYEMAQESETIHIIEHLTFIGAALIGWWPVAGAEDCCIPKPGPPLRMFYLFLLAIPCTCLAAVLTFSSAPMYPFYVQAPHFFGLDALQDQRLGGLLMWLPTHMFLLLAMAITFHNWFKDANQAVPSLLTTIDGSETINYHLTIEPPI